jgi:hypothetical protein
MSVILPSLSQLHEQKLTANDEQRLRELVDDAFETFDDLQIRKLVQGLSDLVSALMSKGVEGLPLKAQPGFRKIVGHNDGYRLTTVEPVLQEINASLASQPLVSTGVALTRLTAKQDREKQDRKKQDRDNFRYDPPAAPPWEDVVKGLVVALLVLVAFYYTFKGAVYLLETVFANVQIGYGANVVRNLGKARVRRQGLQQLGLRK